MAATAVMSNAVRRTAQPSTFRALPRVFSKVPSSQTASPLARRRFSAGPTAFVKKYTQDHEWIELSDDGESATIGVSTYAASALGDVVYVELPQADLEFSAGDSIGAVESVKSASDIMAPVAGTIVEANAALEDTPGMINKSPEGEAWLARIKVKDAGEIDALMDEGEYKTFSEEASKS